MIIENSNSSSCGMAEPTILFKKSKYPLAPIRFSQVSTDFLILKRQIIGAL